jgi:predicted peroxiredoxin
MSTILFYGTYGTDDPTRAVIPFHMARLERPAGHVAEVALIGDATFLMKDEIAKEVKGVAVPNAAEIIAELAGKGLRIHV